MGGMVSGLLIGAVGEGVGSATGGRRIGDVVAVKLGRVIIGSRSSVSGRIAGRIAGRLILTSFGKSRLTSSKFKRNCKFSCRNATIWSSSLKSSSRYMETIQRKSVGVLDGPTVGIAANESVIEGNGSVIEANESVIKAKPPAPGPTDSIGRLGVVVPVRLPHNSGLSSDPSTQSCFPLHLDERRMHAP